MEGVSLAPAFQGKPLGERAIFWEHEGNRAVRQGKWKLVSKHPGGWELYDIDADRTEMHDLAAQNPGQGAGIESPVGGLGPALRRPALAPEETRDRSSRTA